MKRKIPSSLEVGGKALMKTGSPVRQWMYTLENKPRPWLTPVRYAASAEASNANAGAQYVHVRIARIMPPYAIVYHHDGHGWVRLWLDMREAPLYPA